MKKTLSLATTTGLLASCLMALPAVAADRGTGLHERSASQGAIQSARFGELRSNKAKRNSRDVTERILMWFDVMLDTHAISATPGQCIV